MKNSLVGNMGSLPNTETTKALLVAQHFRLVPPSYECEECDSNYILSCRRGRYQWRGPRYDGGCPRCNGKEYNAAAIGFFKGEYQTLWLDKLDALVMWVKDYSRTTICIELHDHHHATIDGWLASFQHVVSNWAKLQLDSGFNHPFFKDMEMQPHMRRRVSLKKPASHTTQKRPATQQRPSTVVLKKPSTALQKHILKKNQKRIFIADESFLNKKKPGKLSKYGRPQKDQIWIWGAVLENNIKTHFLFRILEHPADALDGKPRGHKEMLRNIRSLGLRSGDTFVSDKWKATVSSLKAYHVETGLTTRTLPHEVVNHSEGEIVNSNGFTTNPIEAKWAVMKRWIRKRGGGVLPKHGDREKWAALIYEYQGRNLLMTREHHGIHHDRIRVLRLRAVLNLFAVA